MRQEQKRLLIECWVALFIPKSKTFVCIDHLACQSKQLSEIPVGSWGGPKHGDKYFDRILGIVIPDSLMNFMSCHGFLKNINYVVILKCPKNMLE